MPLHDNFEPATHHPDGGWEFACKDGEGGRVEIKVTAEALEDTAPAGKADRAKFDANRATYAAIASGKFDRDSREGVRTLVVTNYDIQDYEHR